MQARGAGEPVDADRSGLAPFDFDDADGIIEIVRSIAEMEANAGRVVDAARADRVAR